MYACPQMHDKSYSAGALILSYGRKSPLIGLLEEGSAILVRTDYDGNRTILETLFPGDIFGEMITYISDAVGPVDIVCTKDCRVHYIDYDHLIHRCSRDCPKHDELIHHVLQLISRKAVQLSERVDILSRRTTRDKLYCYFSILMSRQGSGSRCFTLPFSFSALAEYLSVDRSAMMRELRHMKEDELILIQKRKVTLLKDLT